LALSAVVLIISHAERQQEAALDILSNYKLKPQPVLYVTGVSPKPLQAEGSAPTIATSRPESIIRGRATTRTAR
jgi:hypothetical protein